MRFKLPNLLPNKKPETKQTGPSAAELLDAFYGKNEEPESLYFNTRVQSVQKFLKQLKVLSPESFDYYQQQLAESMKVHSGTFEDIKNFDKVIDEIEGTNLIWERVLVNTNLWKLNRGVKILFNRTRIMADVGDAMLEYFGRELTQSLLAEDDIFSREDELIEKVPEWEETLNKCREEYSDSVFEANYRMGMLALLNDTINHYDEVSDNPFEDYAEHKTQYNELLFKDIDALKARVKIFQNSCSEKAKLSANGYSLRNEMNRLDNAILMFEVKPDLRLHNHMDYTDEDAKSAFYEVAVIFTCLCKALNQVEHDELMDTIDKSVRADAEERLSSSRSFEDFKARLSKVKKTNDAFNYQLDYAMRLGLISDENWIKAMHVRKCKANAVISMIKKAQENGQDIVVFPPFYDIDSGDFKVYTRQNLKKSQQLDEPFAQMTDSRRKNAKFMYKYPENYVGFFIERLKEQDVNDSEIERDISYTFNEDTGVYNFYINREKRPFYDSEVLKEKCLKANVNTIQHLWKDINKEQFWQLFYQRVQFPGHKDVVSVLKDLHDANIKYYIEYDERFGDGTLYYDSSCEQEAEQLFQKYDYLFPAPERVDHSFDNALRHDWNEDEPIDYRETE